MTSLVSVASDVPESNSSCSYSRLWVTLGSRFFREYRVTDQIERMHTHERRYNLIRMGV